MTPAPPPYSPPRSHRTGTPSEEPYSAIRGLSTVPLRASPEPGNNLVFPPPPHSTHRSRTGSDRSLNLFGLSNVWRRSGGDSASLNNDVSTVTQRPEPMRFASERHEEEVSAPSSRRAASTGAIDTPTTSSFALPQSRWEPGMPLPPPPPMPPPSQGSRSQSAGRATDPVISPPTRRPPLFSNLGPVPPTPANFVEPGASESKGHSPDRAVTHTLHFDTSSTTSTSGASGPNDSAESGSSALTRMHAVRRESKTLRERRSESRTGRQSESRRGSSVLAVTSSQEPISDAVMPSDITVPEPSELQRRAMITKLTPSASYRGEPPNFAQSPPSGQSSTTLDSRGSTPRPTPNKVEHPTPPFSPNTIKGAFNTSATRHPSRFLPTPPPQTRNSVSSPPPVSHIFHTPNNDTINIAPLLPSRPSSASASTSASAAPNKTAVSSLLPSNQFAQAAIERHMEFARKEAAASSDGERVRMFAEFIVAESRLRRERYSTAIDAMGSEILDLTRDLFRPYQNDWRGSSVSRSSICTPESSVEPRSHRGSLMGAILDNHQNPPLSELGLSSGPASPALARPEIHWNEYKPSLSPIPSMSVSEALEGSESRGRPSSRWWEASQEGSTGAISGKLERSKRESKYMGVPKELREALQYVGEGNEGLMNETVGSSQQMNYGPNEYPPEKTAMSVATATSSRLASGLRSPAQTSPITPNAEHLDVSRLVTLPPPYPRHYPAVNNNHPDLIVVRTQVRQVVNLTEVEATKRRFHDTISKLREDRKATATKRRSSFLANIQHEIAIGNLSYAEAAALEASHDTSERANIKETTSQEFDLFQTSVMHPLNELLTERFNHCTYLFDQLRSKLSVEAQVHSPNVPQEEGDEQPELLEKLTLLKWIFEAREMLHREIYDLLTERNARYAEKAMAPYLVANRTAKISHARKFFAADVKKRQKEFHSSILERTEEILAVVEQNVIRGVEVQLSAFWDIAPSLSVLISKIPNSQEGLKTCKVQIPHKEYEENPAYWDYPLLYVYTLLQHCGKATWQFMESQVNLLCLLHEVKGLEVRAKFKVEGLEEVDGLSGEGRTQVMERRAKEEEERLTKDLKERVRVVEELWGNGLGEELEGGKRRVRTFLEGVGGWDEDVVAGT